MSSDTQGDQHNCNRKKKELQFAKHGMCHGAEAEQNIKAEMHLTGHEMPIDFI